MAQNGQIITLRPSGDSATLERRADGNWNLHNDETGSITWNVGEAEIARLIKLDEAWKAHADEVVEVPCDHETPCGYKHWEKKCL